MKLFSKFVWLVLFLILASHSCAEVPASALHLFAREQGPFSENIFSDTEWRWLGNKKDLILGSAYPDYPPFEMTTSGLGLEGVTPDVVGVLARIMGLKVEVRRFENYEAAQEALSMGQIDMLGTTTVETLDRRFMLSLPYIPDQPVIISRIADREPNPRAGRLAVVKDYRSIALLQRAYPAYRIVTYNTFADAAAAVAYGQADLLIGDAMSANYLINKSYFNELRIQAAGLLKAEGYSFALASYNQPLLSILNKAIANLTPQVLHNICNRWNCGRLPAFDSETFHWEASELEWMSAHNNVVPISVNGLLAPIAYYDTNGVFRGMAADILDIIQVKTGLHFVPVRADSISEMVKQVSEEKVLAAAAVTRYGFGKEVLNFTIPYFTDALVLVAAKNEGTITDLETLGKRPLAIIRGTDLAKRLPYGAKGLNIVEVDNSTLAMERMLRGKIDGLLQSKVVSSYYVNRFFADRLRIVGGVDGQVINFSIAVSKADPELLSILNKALLSIPPEELSVLANRWSGPPEASTGSWESARDTVLRISAIAVAGLFISGIWIAYLRRQIRLRIEAQRKLNYQLQLIKTLVDGTPHPIYAVDARGRLLLINTAYRLFFGISDVPSDPTFLRDIVTCNLQAVDQFEELISLALSSAHRVKGDIDVQGQDGPYYFHHWLLPFFDSHNKVVGAIGGWMDVTHERALMVDLKAQKELADKVSQSKSDFLTTMSHEIRTPLNVIIGLLELALGEKEGQIVERNYIRVAYDSSRSLLSILGDILDVAKIEAGRLDICKERVDLEHLLEKVTLSFQSLARHKGLQLTLKFFNRTDKDILVDAVRLRQVLSNLLSNAIKFTQFGEITVHVWLDQQKNDQSMLRIMIADSGAGISEADQRMLFKPFSQAAGHQREQGGTGLGLSISKSLMHLMGGDLQLSSVLGRGTHVYLLLNVQTIEQRQAYESQPTATPAPAESLDIMIVDDHPPNRFLLGQQLRMLGHRVAEAKGGQHALKLLEAQPFDLIFTDCNMPHMSGYSLATRIRSLTGLLEEQLFIYGYTANAQPQITKLCIEAGMNGCFFKPVGLKELSEVIAKTLNMRRERDLAAVKVDCINQLCGGQVELAAQLVAEIISTNTTDVITLQKAIAHKDYTLAGEIVHRIKSASRIISAGKLIEACARYEAYIYDGDDHFNLDNLVSNIAQQVALLNRILNRVFPASRVSGLRTEFEARDDE